MNQEENIIQEDDMIVGEPEAPKPRILPQLAAMMALTQTLSGRNITPEKKNNLITDDNGDQYYWDPVSQSYKKSLLTAKRKR